jgi:hypothetical protein
VSAFSIGDKVQVREGCETQGGFPRLVLGKVYTVTGINPGELVVKDADGHEGGWYESRFEEVSTFREGDVVRCVSSNGDVLAGKEYVVAADREPGETYLAVVTDRFPQGCAVFADRFVLVRPGSEPDETPDETPKFPATVYVTRDEYGNLYIEELEDIDEEDRAVVGRYNLADVGAVEVSETFSFTSVL